MHNPKTITQWSRQQAGACGCSHHGERRERQRNRRSARPFTHQIHSYILQPYQLVKDLRTGVTSTAPGDVLDGALDPFMAAALSQKVTGEKVEVEDID